MIRHFVVHHATIHRKKIIAIIVLSCITLASYIAYYRYFGKLPQSTIYLFTEIRQPLPSDRIVIFSPHEDDEALGVGGYISAAVDANATVHIVFATDGNNMGKKEVRYAEALAADKILGVKSENITFYNIPDKGLLKNEALLMDMVKDTINEIKPTIIITSSKLDTHTDHGELGRVVKAVATTNSSNATILTYLIHYKEFPRPQQFKPDLYMLPPVVLIRPDIEWQKFTLTQSSFDKKSEAVLQYKSQLKTPFLHSLMLSFVRQNELFAIEN